MNKYWSKLTRSLEPYVPGEQPKDGDFIKLNTNENPYGPSPKVVQAIRDNVNVSLRLYPDPEGKELKRTLADYYGLNEGQIFLGNGSDEVLAFSFMAFFNPGEKVLFPDITYSFYKVYANTFNVDYLNVQLNSDFSIPVEGFYGSQGGVIIPNPNAPTGRFLEIDSVEKILRNNMDKVVIIDEAYVDFGGESSVNLIGDFPNLLVVQTMSKSRSLAGLRIGWAMGDKGLIEALERVKNSVNSYTLDRLALVGAVEAVKDEQYFRYTTGKIVSTRERVSKVLEQMGFNVIPSMANFLFISHPSICAEDIFLKLKEKKVLVRYFKQPRIDNYLRVTVGSDDEMDVFLEEINKVLS